MWVLFPGIDGKGWQLAVFPAKVGPSFLTGSQLLCDVLDALPESYPLHSHVRVPFLVAQGSATDSVAAMMVRWMVPKDFV